MKTLTLTLTALTLLATAAFALNEMTLVGQYDGEEAENYFGKSTTMGDFDGDLKYEFVISAYGWNEGMGKVYFYQYDQGWPSDPYITVQGDQLHVSYGWYVPNLGDVSANGLPDLGIPETGSPTDGRLDIFFGANPMDTIPDWSMTAMSQTQTYGSDLDSCGDVNGDGWADFMMKNVYYSDNYTLLEIYHGGEVLDSIPDWAVPSNYFNISGLGDVNGDGFDDIMALGYGAYPNYTPTKIFFGGNPMDTIPDLIFYEYAYLGNGGGVGDVNGDGYPDFCMCMSLPDSADLWNPVYFGGPDLDDIPDVFLLDEYGERTAALNCVTCGDFNGDGYSDIATGDGSLIWGDVVYMYLGGPWFNPIPDAMVTDGSTLYNFGETISTGDVNGDGSDELLVSAINYPWFMQGRVYLYTGPEEWIDYGAGVEPEDLRHYPGWFKLDQNYPNPFNATTTIHFELGKLSAVNLTIYDLKGQMIAQLISDQAMLPGGYNVSWAGMNLKGQPVSSGIYLLEMRVDQYRQIRKMLILR